MWQSHRLDVLPADQPCFGALESLAANAAGHRCRATGLIFGSRPECWTAQSCGYVFSRRCLWLTQDGVYVMLPGHLTAATGLRWITFSKIPLVWSGMTAGVLASVRFVRIQWSDRRSAWRVSFLFPRLPLAPKRTKVYFPHDQD
jgi:hypothetical protein